MKRRDDARRLVLQLAACFFILCASLLVYPQNQQKIDSLKYLVSHAKNDTLKLQALVKLNEINQNRKELIAGYKQQITLGKSLKSYEAACIGYSQLGYYEYENNNFVAAENIVREGMSLAKQAKNYYAMGRFSNRLMLISDKKGDVASAIKFLNQGERFLVKADKKVNLTRLYCNASGMFKDHNLMPKALEYAKKAYAAAQSSGDLEPLGTAAWYLGSCLQKMAKYDSAIYYFSYGLKIAEKLQMPYTQGDMLRGLSDVYSDIRQYKAARDYLTKAVQKYQDVAVTDRVIDCEESMAYLDFMSQDFKTVRDYLLIREKRFSEDSLKSNRYINRWQANLALIDNDVESWKKYYNNYEQAEAALVNDKIQKNFLELEAKYELAKKDRELLQKDLENRVRLWIIAAMSVALFSLVFIAVTQYRNLKNKQRITVQESIIEKQNALSDERFRIAADMHDDVGAGLSRIRYITSSMQATSRVSDGDINKIVSLSDEAVEKMNEIIWALNQGNQQVEELIYYTRSQCSAMLHNAGISFSFEVPENIPSKTLGWKDCRNIYLLIKEAVNNAIKHAGATTISIDCTITDGLQFTIADNGCGFNPDELKEGGNGLLNYKKRVESLRGTYQLITAPFKGTKIVFNVPINTV